MNGKVLEYYFEPEELEGREPKAPSRSAVVTATLTPAEPAVSEQHPSKPAPEPTHAPPRDAVVLPPVDDVRPEHELVSVHALGQYAFCPRSAVLAQETGDSAEPDEPPPRLDYLPCYDLARIDEALSTRLRWAALALAVTGLAAVASLRGWLVRDPWTFYGAFAVFAPALVWLARLVGDVARLQARRLEALRADGAELLTTVRGVTSIRWWELVRGGYEAASYELPFRHPELPLAGSPWRVLEHGSLRIPVLKSGSDKLGPAPGRVFAKNELRVAAYAMLLEAMGHKTPFGVVLPAGSTRGLAVPVTESAKADVRRVLGEMSETLRLSRSGQAEPRVPAEASRCLACPHGYPERLTVLEDRPSGVGKKLLVLRRQSGEAYHCVCGDRFGSAPPHGEALRLGLHAPIV